MRDYVEICQGKAIVNYLISQMLCRMFLQNHQKQLF